MSSLEAQVRLLLDYQEIANLKATYLSNADGGWGKLSHNAEVVASLFAEDGVWKSDSHGEVKGRDAIRETFLKFQKAQPFAFHSAATPLIRVDGDYAEGEWHLIMFGTLHTGKPFWSAGVYEDKFKRTAEGWRLLQVYTRAVFINEWGGDWVEVMAQQARLREAQQKGTTADRPSGWPDLYKEAKQVASAQGQTK
jgi:ketosteroid isomerase-like protein